jgi:hypothetical protein
MSEVGRIFEDAWDKLRKNYESTIEDFYKEKHRYPYGVYWKETEIVSELHSILKRTIPKEYEIHLNVTFNPKDWKILKKHITRSGRWPQIDIVILRALENEGWSKPFSLIAEVKYSEPNSSLKRRSSDYGSVILKDVRRLKKYLMKDRVCKEAFFCYFDEYHTNGPREKIEKKIKDNLGKVRLLVISDPRLRKTKNDEIVIRESTLENQS